MARDALCPEDTVTDEWRRRHCNPFGRGGVRTPSLSATQGIVRDHSSSALRLNPARQLIGAQCSGSDVAKLGLLETVPACTDLTTKPWVQEAGVEVLNQPFYAAGNIATAGGCLSSQYLAAWIIARTEGLEAARSALHYVAPVGEKDEYVARAMKNIAPYLPPEVKPHRALAR